MNLNKSSLYSLTMYLLLVHSGPEFPTYLNDCIAQARSVSNIPIHVLIDSIHVDKIKDVKDITIVPLDSIPKDYFTKQYLSTCMLDVQFRNGFWRAASLRFFYIYNYVRTHDLRNVFHIEYDNLIYYDFTKLLPVFQTRPMSCVLDAPLRCVPSFVYWRDADALFDLVLSLLNAGARGENDMIALARHAHAYPHKVLRLPIVTPDYAGIDAAYSSGLAEFGVLFDGAAVGQYIGGVDPRNTSGDTRGFINETTVFKCDRVRVTWRNGAPFLNDVPLVNLHIHSKDLRAWISK